MVTFLQTDECHWRIHAIYLQLILFQSVCLCVFIAVVVIIYFRRGGSNWLHCSISCLIIHQIFSLARDWSKRVTWPNIPQLKLGNIREYSPIFKTVRVAKKIWRIINAMASIWGENMLGYLSLDITCSSKLTNFLELRSRKTVRFWEQTMSTDKYLSIFSRHLEAIVYIVT